MNALKAHFVRHKQKQGFTIEFVRPADDGLVLDGKSLLAKGKHLSHDQYCQSILNARSLTRAEYDALRGSIRAGEQVSEADKWAYEKATLQYFYRQSVCPELVALDDRGRFRRSVMLFEAVFQDRELTRLNFHAPDRSRFVVTNATRATAIITLLDLTPLVKDGKLVPEAVIQQSDLSLFAETLVKHKAIIETHLGVVRSDVKSKSVQQLGAILKLIGMRLVRLKASKKGGAKIYQYRLAPDWLSKMMAVVEARKARRLAVDYEVGADDKGEEGDN